MFLLYIFRTTDNGVSVYVGEVGEDKRHFILRSHGHVWLIWLYSSVFCAVYNIYSTFVVFVSLSLSYYSSLINHCGVRFRFIKW